MYEVLTWAAGILVAAFLGVFSVYAFGIKTSVIGPSMEPVLSAGQEILLDRIIYQFTSVKRGDVIVFHPNGNQNTHLYVKRVLGLPGERATSASAKTLSTSATSLSCRWIAAARRF